MKNLLLKPWFTAAIITLLTGFSVLVVLLFWRPINIDGFMDNLLSSIVMMFFEVVIVVFLFALVNSTIEKRQRIERYEEEIEDYRPWKDEEATWRLRGLIRRMNKLGKSGMLLEGATLKGANLSFVNLEGSNLIDVNLESANLESANLKDTAMLGANLVKAYLSNTKLEGAYLEYANLSNAYIINVNLSGVDLLGANLENLHLHMAFLEGCEIETYQLKNVEFDQGVFMMDGTPYDESWAKRIAEAVEPNKEESCKK
jgi:BTB/POZ domain-containing protein KCTD9